MDKDQGMITQSQKTNATNRNENVLNGHFKEEKTYEMNSKVSRGFFYPAICLVNNGPSVSIVARIICCSERLDYFHSEKITLFFC